MQESKNMVIPVQENVLSEKPLPQIMVLVPDLRIPGGVSNYYKTLQLDADPQVQYFVINEVEQQGAFAAIIRLFKKYCSFSYKLLKREAKFVVINPSLDEGKSFYRDMVFILLTLFFNCKPVVFFRGWFDPFEEKIRHSKFKTFMFSISYAKAYQYMVLGKTFKQKLLSLGVPASTPFHIETTVADSTYISSLNLAEKFGTYEEELKFLFLSRIEKEKGVYIAIDAFTLFINRFPTRKATLIIAGDGRDLAEVRAYVAGKNLQRIRFDGHVSAETKKKVLLEAHVMIFPSFTEGLPNVILEGMLYGFPIVARGTGGIPEVVDEKVNGYITDSYDAEVFAELLYPVAFDGELYKRMAETNHHKALSTYTSEQVKARIRDIYRNF